MISNTWRITEMFHIPSKTINHYVYCALFYNTSDNIIHHSNRTEQQILYTTHIDICEISKATTKIVWVTRSRTSFKATTKI